MRPFFKKVVIFLSLLFIAAPLINSIAPTVQADEQAMTNSTLDPDIIPGQVLVKYKRQIHSLSMSAQSISPLIETIHIPLEDNINSKITQLEKDPNVEYAEPVYRVHSTAYPDDDGSITNIVYNDLSQPSYMHNWGKSVTQLTYAMAMTNPASTNGVIVAVIDTGVDLTHPDLVASAIIGNAGRNFINSNLLPIDDNGHGTNVAGIIAAKSHDLTGASGYSGVAPGTKILPIKVLDSRGQGSTSTVISGIQHAMSHGANIINLSLGTTEDSQALHDSIKAAVNAGILVVAAAGNDGNNWIDGEAGQWNNPPDTHRNAGLTLYPALYKEVLSVGAIEQLTNSALTIADFSNVLKVDVVAPGVNIYSTYLYHDYYYMHGTSQATPSVAGFAALLKADNMSLTPDRLTAIIKNSATPLSNPGLPYENIKGNHLLANADIFGSGLVNGQKSFQLTRLDMNLNVNQFITNNTLFLHVEDQNYKGIVNLVNSSAHVFVHQLSEDDGVKSVQSQTLINLNNGVGNLNVQRSINLPSFYHYVVSVIDDVYSQHITSNAVEIVNRPTTPSANLYSGIYDGPQQIVLSSTASDSIYYSLNNGVYTHYSGPFTISQNSTLKSYALNNHVFSAVDGNYTYIINQPAAPIQTSNPLIGGGGGGGFVPPIGGGGGLPAQLPVLPLVDVSQSPTPTPTPTPGATPELKLDKDKLLDQINNSTSKEIVINVPDTVHNDKKTTELSGDIFQKANSNNKSLLIKFSNDVQFVLPPNALNVQDSQAAIQFSSTSQQQQADNIPDAKTISKIFDFSLTVNGDRVTKFAAPLKVSFTFDPSKVKDPSKLGVYYHNPANGKWEYVAGTLTNDHSITASLVHFSEYVVLESNKTFNDIQNHWAKNDIEEMAAKQIINGMTEQTFQPDSSITRAQFVSLLSRSLKLNNTSSEQIFSDVQAASWYANDVYAAYHARIVNGKTEQIFAPDDKITREQLATLLINAYLTATGKQLSDIVITQEVKYTDEGNISSWARSNVRIATSLGFMSGVGNGIFNPTGYANRAEAAVVLKRFLNRVN